MKRPPTLLEVVFVLGWGILGSKKSKLPVDKAKELGYYLIRYMPKLGDRLSGKEAEMFDPMQAYYASAHTPTPTYQNLDEEQLAQRYGRVVGGNPLWCQVWLRVGKFLIQVGEKLTAENTPINLHKETA